MKTSLIILILVLTGCSLFTETDDRLEGHEARPALISFKQYFMSYVSDLGYFPSFRDIDTLQYPDTFFVRIGEFIRSDGKPCPADGNDLYVKLYTQFGEEEIYALNTKPDFIGGTFEQRRYIRIVDYQVIQSSANPTRYNGILELNSEGDQIYAEYNTYWNGFTVYETLIYSK